VGVVVITIVILKLVGVHGYNKVG